ncbi:splicing regulator SDE2 isoform X2 [Takifugu rubripes]|uniref:splicing regulator SDE2 isoform X2 n=1 Tax=Takifugu rubripes TaxID=31033 RepID=UPI0005D17E32|nr:replication stress response regulator SDE2 isoform X2 [Takifugu rubripes]|eukprot:XP_011611004.1 PREDICTED: protein SDE2 homolog [Takifugu rubripes]
MKMEVFVRTSMFSFANWSFTDDSVVREVLDRFVQKQGGGSSNDFYVVQNGRLSNLDEPLQRGAIYHLEPRLCGGKGGFGSMLRALGAQIEKTTNREACRDLSGRRLRDVNHEKEMADWLKKQAEREAEKEQRQVERLQRKLREPEHRFSDMEFQQQCHELSERLEDSVIKGLQVSSPGQMKAGHSSTTKRHNLSQSKEPHAKKMMSELWTGLEELQSSEEDDSNEDDYVSFSHISTDYIATEREQISRDHETRLSDQQDGPGPSTAQETRPSDNLEGPGPSTAQETRPLHQQEGPGPSTAQETRPLHQLEGPGPFTTQETKRPGEFEASQQQVHHRLDLATVTSVEHLEILGLDVLKDELRCRGLKCGGTLTERAARLFSIRGLTPEQINPALLAKPTKAKKK